MESIRAFIAIELPEVVKSSLAELQNDLKRSEHAPVKWVAPDSIHLTLKFLGNVDAPKTEPIEAAISQAAKAIRPFSLQLGAPGALPNLGAPRVVCVGLGGDTTSLVALHRSIERSLAPLGFSLDKRPFSPHLTLGRVRDSASPSQRRGLGEAVSSLKAGPSLAFETKAVNLMQSTLTRERAIYNCLASAALGED